MSRNLQGTRNGFTGEATMRHYSAWLLCALLLVFCASAKLDRYELRQHNVNQASARAFLDGREQRGKPSNIPPLLLWCVAGAALYLFLRTSVVLLPSFVPTSQAFSGFDPESHLRPPPPVR
jgi:hypothetical protein